MSSVRAASFQLASRPLATFLLASLVAAALVAAALSATSCRPPDPPAGAPVAAPEPAPPAEVLAWLRAAGGSEDELERLSLLRQVAARPDLGPRLRAELASLLPVVEAWAEGRARADAPSDERDAAPERASAAAENGYLCSFITGRVQPTTATRPAVPPAPAAGSPLRPLWGLYRGRMLIWQAIESTPIERVPARRAAFHGEGRALLAEARAAFPENRVIGMYLGEAIPWPAQRGAEPSSSAAAPEWARLQREGLEKLTDIIHWWIDERQLADGQFGGGWGDDVEMWRWWTPVLVGFEDEKVAAAQERLSRGMFAQASLRAGYTARMTDVEHGAEDSTDAILPMMHLAPGDPLWRGRALRLAELMRERWTGVNRRGFLQFKAIYFNAEGVDADAGQAFDTVYHPAAVQPALLLWQRTGEPELGELFGGWLDTWVDAARREENGKPAGVLPSVIAWPAGSAGKPGRPWWQPFAPAQNDALYNWPFANLVLCSALLQAGQVLDDERYFEPIRSMAELRRRHLGSPSGGPEPPTGSAAWCARNMDGFLPETLAKLRVLSGDARFDALLRAEASGYVRYRLDGDEAALVEALRESVEAFRWNREAFTSEVRWTDRVLSFTSNYLRYQEGAAPPPVPTPEILYSTVTGDPGQPIHVPLNAVRWLTPPRDIAALVTDSGPERFRARLFHFGEGKRAMGAELYLLAPGEHAVTLVSLADGRTLWESRLVRDGPRSRLSFALPPGLTCELRVDLEGAASGPVDTD